MLSAKWWTLQNVIAFLRSFIYNKNTSPRTDPWGMPQFIAARPGFDLTLRNADVKNFATDLFLSNLILVAEGRKFYSKKICQTTGQYIWKWISCLKLVSAIFSKFFIFSPNDSPSKTEKCSLFHLKSSFCSQDILILYFCPSHFFYLSAIALEDDQR